MNTIFSSDVFMITVAIELSGFLNAVDCRVSNVVEEIIRLAPGLIYLVKCPI